MAMTVSTACPYCNGTIMLLDVVEGDVPKAEIVTQFAAMQLECPQPECGRTFRVRRNDVNVRRRSSPTELDVNSLEVVTRNPRDNE